jgi:ABC-type oligopeptide transport system substrate-binding subunit
MSLKLVKNSGNGAVSVMMDGKIYNNNNNALSVKAIDPKTVHIDLFVPSGDHALQIKGIRNAA